MIEFYTKFWRLANRLLGFCEKGLDYGEAFMDNAIVSVQTETKRLASNDKSVAENTASVI